MYHSPTVRHVSVHAVRCRKTSTEQQTFRAQLDHGALELNSMSEICPWSGHRSNMLIFA